MQDFKVKDISLAEFGRQEILLAQDEMPALGKTEKVCMNALKRKQFQTTKNNTNKNTPKPFIASKENPSQFC